jgi:hypothetical protein
LAREGTDISIAQGISRRVLGGVRYYQNEAEIPSVLKEIFSSLS